MPRYKINNTYVDTSKAQKSWGENVDWDGSYYVSRATESQYTHETLYQTRKGKFYIVRTCDWQGTDPVARFVEADEAADWLMRNKITLPENLRSFRAGCENN